MARATYADLIVEVRAQIDATDDIIYGWLLDRSRVLNAETSWLLVSTPVDLVGARFYFLPEECLWVEALIVADIPYQRATNAQMDAAYAGVTPPCGIYSDGAGDRDPLNRLQLQVFPDASPVSAIVRYVADVPDDRTLSPPFPPDFDEALVEGAIAMGLARMDERFDSAGYFDERFVNALDRLRRRRHGRIGRGATKIRMAG